MRRSKSMTASALALAAAWMSLTASQAQGATLTVKAGESIQAAVKRALPASN